MSHHESCGVCHRHPCACELDLDAMNAIALASSMSVHAPHVIALVAEVRRLRAREALPVIETCGQCRHHMPIETTDPTDYAWCGHDDAPGTESYDAKTPYYAAPPQWCPLRTPKAPTS